MVVRRYVAIIDFVCFPFGETLVINELIIEFVYDDYSLRLL